MNPPLVQIQLNGDRRTVPDSQGLAELIASLALPPQAVLVEHNGHALLRSEWASLRLADGDRLEILRVVAGG